MSAKILIPDPKHWPASRYAPEWIEIAEGVCPECGHKLGFDKMLIHSGSGWKHVVCAAITGEENEPDYSRYLAGKEEVWGPSQIEALFKEYYLENRQSELFNKVINDLANRIARILILKADLIQGTKETKAAETDDSITVSQLREGDKFKFPDGLATWTVIHRAWSTKNVTGTVTARSEKGKLIYLGEEKWWNGVYLIEK